MNSRDGKARHEAAIADSGALADADESAADDADFDGLDVEDPAAPTEHQLAGGAPRSFALLLIAGGLVGLVASIALVLSQIELLEDPNSILSCDINPLIGCSSSLLAWQSHLFFGIPNAVMGTAIFGMVLVVGLMFLAGARVGRWFWQLMVVAVLAGFAFVAWFLTQSITEFRTLCPWCMVSWAVVLGVGFPVIGRAAQAGHLPVGKKLSRTLYLERWLLLIGAVVVILAVIGVGLWGTWRIILGI